MKGVMIFSCIILFASCQVCVNEIKKSEKLDKNNKIILFSRAAGATTGTSLQISIIRSEKTLSNSMKGNICITNGDYLNYQIDDYFITTYTGELFLRREGFQNYTIEYVQKK
jgi:hypothetical protein